ncbi:MAG: hypothetical protein IPP29_22940 [Bacteroidetes bacterium]|nr:hypothetical protein [Bacteroidota bacterium]
MANNIIKGIRINLSVSTQVNGIRITNSTSTPSAATVLRVYNNSVSNVTSAYLGAALAWAGTTGIKGINLASLSSLTQYTYEIYNNTVSIDGSGSPTATSTAFQRATTTAGSMQGLIQNNIWANFTGAQVAPASHYALVNGVVGSATALGPVGSFVNNNDLWIADPTQGFAARGATTDYLSVAFWEAANAPQAISNATINPMFFNNLSDLHVNNGALDGLGTTYPVYLTEDLDCISRTGVADLGAFLIVPCTGIPVPGTLSANPSRFVLLLLPPYLLWDFPAV